MPISFNIDLTERRRRKAAQDQLGGIRDLLRGQEMESPPQAGMPIPRTGILEQTPEAQLIDQLLSSPLTAERGISEALNVMERQRLSQQQGQQQQGQQSAIQDIVKARPEFAQLASLIGTPGAEGKGLQALIKGVTPQQAGSNIDPVQSSNILPGGLVQIVRKSGAVDLVTPEQENIEKIQSAERYGADLQGLRAGERTEATNASKSALAAFQGLTGVRKSIASMDEGIKLLGEGAGVGAIESRFPSIKAASVKLDNLQGRMGLNVIQNTTFGSLSEQELKFALSTALPQGLNTAELKQWMTEKRAAQDKLASYLEETAIFLGTPGNNIADYLRMKKTQQFTQIPTSAAPPPPGSVIRQVK